MKTEKSAVEKELNEKLQERMSKEETLSKEKLHLEKSKAVSLHSICRQVAFMCCYVNNLLYSSLDYTLGSLMMSLTV